MVYGFLHHHENDSLKHNLPFLTEFKPRYTLKKQTIVSKHH